MRNLNSRGRAAVLMASALLLCLLASSSVQARSSHKPHYHRRSLKAPVNQTFPYQTCNTTASWNLNPWNAVLDYQQDMNGNTQVIIRVWAAKSLHIVNLGTLEIFVPTESVLKRFNGSFVNAKISIGKLNSTNYTGIVWSPHRRFIRFPKLNFNYLVGANTSGYKISFTMINGSMSSLCPRSCKYAVITGKRCAVGELGWVPIIVVDGPDFVQNASGGLI